MKTIGSMVPSPPIWLQQWSSLVAGLGTVVLTTFLVILYKRQKEQLAAQHKAVLEVTDVEWYGDRAILWLSNFGNGVAKNLYLTILVKSDTGEHRTHAGRSNALKRIDKEGEWTNLIQPSEENVPFQAKAKVGQPAPINWPKDWTSLKFSSFVREAKENGSSEVKYLPVVKGNELSGNVCYDTVYPMTRSVNPQEFEFEHSLGDLPGQTEHGLDETFIRYFRESTSWKVAFDVYERVIRILNWLLPVITLRPRVLDASGTKRVKRVLLKRDLRHLVTVTKERITSFPSSARERISGI